MRTLHAFYTRLVRVCSLCNLSWKMSSQQPFRGGWLGEASIKRLCFLYSPIPHCQQIHRSCKAPDIRRRQRLSWTIFYFLFRMGVRHGKFVWSRTVLDACTFFFGLISVLSICTATMSALLLCSPPTQIHLPTDVAFMTNVRLLSWKLFRKF